MSENKDPNQNQNQQSPAPAAQAPVQDPAQKASGTESAPAQKDNLMSKITGGVSWWLGSLTGKPMSRRANAPTTTGNLAPPPPTILQEMPKETVPFTPGPQAPVSATNEPEEIDVPLPSQTPTVDPVAQDLDSLKKLVGKVSGKVKTTVGPQVQKGVSSTSQATTSFVKTVDKGFIKKILQVFLILVFLMVAVFVAMRLFKTFQENGGNAQPTGSQVQATPSPIVYEPFKPSLYAEDPEVLKLEEDINVLVREISGSNIKEITLNPPTLDFNITF